MKELKYFIFGILAAFSVGLYSCQNDDVADPSATDDNEQTFTVLEDVTTKGSTDILEGCNTYKTGEYVKVKAKSGATISGTRLRGSGSVLSEVLELLVVHMRKMATPGLILMIFMETGR